MCCCLRVFVLSSFQFFILFYFFYCTSFHIHSHNCFHLFTDITVNHLHFQYNLRPELQQQHDINQHNNHHHTVCIYCLFAFSFTLRCNYSVLSMFHYSFVLYTYNKIINIYVGRFDWLQTAVCAADSGSCHGAAVRVVQRGGNYWFVLLLYFNSTCVSVCIVVNRFVNFIIVEVCCAFCLLWIVFSESIFGVIVCYV